jgi:hypothetical protein
MRVTETTRRSEVALLAAIHKWAGTRAPRISRLLPGRAGEGDPVIVVGENLSGGELVLRFGSVATWAVALSDRAALGLVPAGAAPGLVTAHRQGLRSNGVVFGGPPDDGGPWVTRIDPRDGATGAFRDTPVLARLSHALDPATLTATSFRIERPSGPVPGRLMLSPDAKVVVWTPESLLEAGSTHFVLASGLRDVLGREVAPHVSRFVPCDITWEDLGH